jgi:hypothetical protein
MWGYQLVWHTDELGNRRLSGGVPSLRIGQAHFGPYADRQNVDTTHTVEDRLDWAGWSWRVTTHFARPIKAT